MVNRNNQGPNENPSDGQERPRSRLLKWVVTALALVGAYSLLPASAKATISNVARGSYNAITNKLFPGMPPIGLSPAAARAYREKYQELTKLQYDPQIARTMSWDWATEVGKKTVHAERTKFATDAGSVIGSVAPGPAGLLTQEAIKQSSGI
ncbi:hypothetical protein HYW84_03615 [Candidatus Peregrinibacteria bacterium]|nr:hypothetical protein [Candidatus Peregrinibacteria bacterium]